MQEKETLRCLMFEITMKIYIVVSGTGGKNDEYYRKHKKMMDEPLTKLGLDNLSGSGSDVTI